MLNEGKIILTDIILRTNRKDKSPLDSSLRVREAAPKNIINQFAFNDSIIKIIQTNQSIKYIFFTAQGSKGNTPAGWFFEMLRDNSINHEVIKQFPSAMELHLFDIKYYLFFLPTPSSQRSLAFTKDRRHPLLKNYIEENNTKLYLDLKILEFDKERFSTSQKDSLKEMRENFVRELWIQFIGKKNYQYDGGNPHHTKSE
jgi:hypothetical protein